MLIKKACVIAAMAIPLIGLSATAAMAQIPPPGGGGNNCHPSSIRQTHTQYGGNGFDKPGWFKETFSNFGGCIVETQTHCTNGFAAHYYEGPMVGPTGTGSSRADCEDGFVATLYDQQGYEYWNGSAWKKVDTFNA